MEAVREQHSTWGYAAPDSVDWTTGNVVGPVKDQGSLGSCWAFSTAENIACQYAIATGTAHVSLSVEQLLECDPSSDASCDGLTQESLGCGDCGMFGGWPYLAYDYVKNAGGIFTEAEFPYSWNNDIYPCMATGYSRQMCGGHATMYCNAANTLGQCEGGFCSATSGQAVKVTGWKSLSTDETELATQLAQYGPLSVLINADNLQHYGHGVWTGGSFGNCKVSADEGIMGLDHAVLLVGYGMDKKTPYWKVQNSWGTKWGEHGFFRIQRGTGMCGINLAATTAEVSSNEDEVVV